MQVKPMTFEVHCPRCDWKAYDEISDIDFRTNHQDMLLVMAKELAAMLAEDLLDHMSDQHKG